MCKRRPGGFQGARRDPSGGPSGPQGDFKRFAEISRNFRVLQGAPWPPRAVESSTLETSLSRPWWTWEPWVGSRGPLGGLWKSQNLSETWENIEANGTGLQLGAPKDFKRLQESSSGSQEVSRDFKKFQSPPRAPRAAAGSGHIHFGNVLVPTMVDVGALGGEVGATRPKGILIPLFCAGIQGFQEISRNFRVLQGPPLPPRAVATSTLEMSLSRPWWTWEPGVGSRGPPGARPGAPGTRRHLSYSYIWQGKQRAGFT